jgi:predicted neuraminidase
VPARRLAVALTLSCLASAASIHADDAWTDADVLEQPGVVSAEFVFEEAPHPQCHASTIVETKTGLVAAWFGGTHEKHDDVGIWVSRRVDGAWTVPVEVADGSEGEEREFPCWNPVLFQPKEGPLLLFYKVGPSPDTWWGTLLTSDDGGRTWGNRRRLGEDPAVGHLLGPVKNKPVQLADGSILCPSSTEHDGWRVHFERTTDLGKTWQVIGPIHDASKFNAIQPSILVHADGALQVLCRTKEQVISTSRSTDGGRTWGPMTATSLPNPNAGTDAVTLADGRHLLVYNHTTRAKGFPSGRNMLNVALSEDGRTWGAAAILERSPGEFSYPAVIQTADGKVHVTYTWQRRRVRHVVLDPSQFETTAIER